MPRFPVSPYWSSNPNIPIYLDRSDSPEKNERDKSESAHADHTPEYVCPTCETSSRDTPIHCVSVSPSPPSYNSIAPPATSPRLLTVPTLTVQTPRHWSRPQAPTRSLQFDPEGRPHVRFRRNAFSPISPPSTDIDETDWDRRSHIGLGIPAAQFQPDATPITPGTAERGEDGDPDQQKLNIAQRIEQKLWNYTASKSVWKRWLLEIISWVLSALCMAGIGIMLTLYHDKNLPKWPLGLTLNAYISILSKVASAALLLPVSEALGQLKWSWFQGDNSKKMWDFEIFDNASRGPWGSFLLLVRTKGRSLAALGAAVTIFSLCLDPFFQQVVEYPEQWRLQENRGFIQRAIGYNPLNAGSEFQNGLENLEYDNTIRGLTYNYFYNNGTAPIVFGKGVRSEVPLSCPHSNCTWPEYETLGMQSECVDASDRLEFRCAKAKLDWLQEPYTDGVNEATYPNGTSCGYWLMSDPPLLMTGYNIDENTNHSGEVLLTRSQPLIDIFSREFISGYQPQLNNSRNPLAHVVTVSGHGLEDIHQNKTPIAHECMISWTVLTMSSSYSEGGYIEDITKRATNDTTVETPWLTTRTYDEDGLFIGYDYIYNEDVIIKGVNDTIYRIDNRTHLLAVSLFDDIFPNTYSVLNSTDETKALLRYKEYNTISPYTRNLTYNPFMYGNITTHLDRMTTSITNAVRAYSRDTDMVSGLAFDLESIVVVRWPWLILPLGLLSLTAVFLLATIIRSAREGGKVYKTSAIATLLYGFNDDMQKKMESEKVQGTPREKAKVLKTKWNPSGGWRFSGNSVSPTSVRMSTSPASPVQFKARQSPPVGTTSKSV
ncbi:hypothetical protein PMIN06_010145 [Paraphaeosphaeria minitans]